MKTLVNKNLDKKALFNMLSNSEHIMATLDKPFKLTGISYNTDANGQPIAYLIGDGVAYFTDATSLINETVKLAGVFENEILTEGVDIVITHIKTGKDKTVYRLSLV